MVLQFSVCKRKLHSKEAALKILKAELDHEQDQKEHYKRVISVMVGNHEKNPVEVDKMSLEDVLVILAERDNRIKSLNEKVKELQCKQEKSLMGQYSASLLQQLLSQRSQWNKERQELICQLENSSEQVSKLQLQIHTLEDNNEEMISEKKFLSSQCDKLAAELDSINNAKQSLLTSSDAAGQLLAQNRQLRLKLLEAELERDKALSKIDRYKRAVERRKQKELHSQEVQYKIANKRADTLQRVHELEFLANGLSETVKEKNIALEIQRKTNRALAGRITELEQKIYLLELAHVTDAFGKQCHVTSEEASHCSEGCGDIDVDQLQDTLQVFDHTDTTDVI